MKTFRYKLGHVAGETMTVAELRAKLAEYPDDMPVFGVWEGCEGYIMCDSFRSYVHDKRKQTRKLEGRDRPEREKPPISSGASSPVSSSAADSPSSDQAASIAADLTRESQTRLSSEESSLMQSLSMHLSGQAVPGEDLIPLPLLEMMAVLLCRSLETFVDPHQCRAPAALVALALKEMDWHARSRDAPLPLRLSSI